jgi:PAS domain S-box-containing protein
MKNKPAAVAEDPNDEITALVRKLHDTQQRLRELTGGEVDAVLHSGGQSYLLHEAQEKLQQSEEKFRQLADNVTDVFWMTSPDMQKMHYVSPAYEHIWGRSVESLHANPHQWAEAILPEERERVFATFSRLAAAEPSVNTEFPIARPDGTVRWIFSRGFQVLDAARKVIRITGIASDITGRKLAEIDSSRLAAIIESSDDAIIGKDLNSIITSWNKGAEKIFGYAASEVLGTSIMRLIPADRCDEENQILGKIKRGESVGHFETLRQTKDGRLIDVSVTVSPIKDATGKVFGVSKVARDITERKQAEAELRATHAQLRQLLEHSPAVIYSLRVEGQSVTPVFVSENIERLLGVSVAESTRYEWWLESLHPDDRERVLSKLSESLSGDGYSMEYRIRHQDGSYRWIEDNNRVVRDASGEATEAVGVWTDITERKQAEVVLKESERRFREMLENVELIAVTLDKDGTVTFCNDYLLRLTGWKREEVIGTDWFSNFIPDANVAAKKVFLETIEVGEIPTHYENPIKTRTGELREITWNNTMLRDTAGNIVGTASLGEDVTERNRAEARVREQADIINRAHDAIVVLNFKDQRITFWNSGAERLYGWSADDAIGRSIGELIFADAQDYEGPQKVLDCAGEFHGEIKQVAKDGREIIVDSRATLIRNQDGTPRSGLLINTDVTEQKRLETHLLRAQRLESIGTLASGVAHELNNILTPILICAEVLKDNSRPADLPALVSLIEESAKRGTNVVKQVLTFARGVEGERVLIKPSHLIQEMIDIAQNTFPKTIELRSLYPEDIWSVQVDPTQLHQVLLNLSVNARDAMPNGGSLTIGAENFEVDEHYASMTPGAKPGPHVMFRVTDTGVGISRAAIDKIFHPFFTTKEIGKGTGLGLSTVLGIVKSHGGFISVYSEIGTGTTFKIFLPAKVSEESPQKSKMPPELLEGNGELVLVVDDEPGIVQMTKMILENRNYRVLTAEDGPDALSPIAQQTDPIKVVLTDMSMPFMDGVALIRAIKKMKPATMFIASTGQGEKTRTGELESLGVKNFLTKPYDTQTLLTTVRDTLNGAPSNPVH